MNTKQQARDIEAARTRTARAQAEAADPAASVWVNANAGTGKTHVLTLRVLRLLLAGTPPQRILCLTYTKAAAAEMSKRVFDQLASWVTAPGDALTAMLTEIVGSKPDAKLTAFARTLFTRAIETPGGLKVQTIHAFSERLLQRFPLEAGVPPGFKILDDEKGRELKARAIEGTLEAATARPGTPLAAALSCIVRYAADSNFDELLSKAINERAWLDAATRINLGRSGDDFAAAEALLRSAFGVRDKVTMVALDTERAKTLSSAEITALRDHLAGGSKTDTGHSETLSRALAASEAEHRAEALGDYVLVDKGNDARASLMTKALAVARPDLLAIATTAQARFFALTQEAKALRLVEATAALYRLAGAVLQRYRAAKMAAGALDFDDLIERTTNLLMTSSNAEWVLFKLDGGLDHILVDEAQDTSPAQWSIIEALGAEFFAGVGARDTARTIFAVGDEKQSIYSFQGAAPEMFARMGETFAALAGNARGPWRRVPLNLSFRTVQPVLDAVDSVFSDAERTPGLTAAAGTIQHIASRAGQSGRVEIWPTEKMTEAAETSPWDPLGDTAMRAPANRLAERIADTIAGWLNSGERLRSEDRAVRAGDILILVRKRQPFAVPMVAALKARGIAVAGSDRMALTDQIAVEDLLALGDFVTLPEDDLALANVLKGPLFNLDDNDLMTIAVGRKGALWKAFLAHADHAAKYKPAAETLKRWRAKADFMPPFEFYASLLDRDGGRAKMLRRLGPEAADAIDEFLDLALSYDDSAPPSLTGFLANLRAQSRDVKRDMDHGRNEVRVMTVHGAKGLEAPIVFLPDTCTTASGDGAALRLLKLSDVKRASGLPDPVVWPVKGTSALPPVRAATGAKDARDAEERNRLLYVAMTRARDRLYVAGFEGGRGRADGCWYDLIATGLGVRPDDAGFAGWQSETAQQSPPEMPKVDAAVAATAQDLPAFALRRVAAEPQLSVPLAPSRLEAYAPDAEGEPLVATTSDPARTFDRPSPLTSPSEHRFLRGTLTHALLEHLPAIAATKREAAATAFIAARGAVLSKKAQASIVRETLAILAHGDFAVLFGPTSRAEVPISAVIPRPPASGKGPALKLSGQIDRLAMTDRDVLIIDYKTNRPPPRDIATVAPAYLFQLAAYALALREIYPKHKIRPALLWTDGPRLMEIPESLINGYIARLWNLDSASLDAA
jgi:ATP-dependent helicase/nuclease subunit A